MLFTSIVTVRVVTVVSPQHRVDCELFCLPLSVVMHHVLESLVEAIVSVLEDRGKELA